MISSRYFQKGIAPPSLIMKPSKDTSFFGGHFPFRLRISWESETKENTEEAK